MGVPARHTGRRPRPETRAYGGAPASKRIVCDPHAVKRCRRISSANELISGGGSGAHGLDDIADHGRHQTLVVALGHHADNRLGAGRAND